MLCQFPRRFLLLALASVLSACHRPALTTQTAFPPAPDPLISGQRLSVWIASLEDRDPEVQMRTLQAIGKLERGRRKRADGTLGPVERATDAELAYQPLKAMQQRNVNMRVTLALQYDLYTLFQEVDSRNADVVLQMLANGTDEESGHAETLLKHYPDKADQITDAAVKLVADAKARALPHVNGILLLSYFPAQGWPKISQAHSSGDHIDQLLFASAQKEVRPRAVMAGVLPKNAPQPPPPTADSSVVPDWPVLAAQAKASAQAWQARYKMLSYQYLNLFASFPHNDHAPDFKQIGDAEAAHTPEGAFERWNNLGKDWRASCADLERRIALQQP